MGFEIQPELFPLYLEDESGLYTVNIRLEAREIDMHEAWSSAHDINQHRMFLYHKSV